MSNFLIFKAAFNNSATPAIGTYTAEGATARFNMNPSLSPDYYLYNTADGTAVQWFVPTAETTDFEFVADILTRYWTNRVTYFIIADSTGTTRLRMWSQYSGWIFENSDSISGSGDPEHIGTVSPTTSGGFGVFHQFRVRVRKLTASSSSVEVYVDGTLKLTATAGAALVTCAKIGFVGGVNTFGPGTGAGIKNAYVYDLSGGDVIDRGVLSGAFNRFISWMKSKFALKSDIPTVNDATLTIQRNGTNVQTFTANASANKTANIVVPTAVSELTNDSGYLTSSSNLDASKLTSGTVDIARLPQGALERLVKVANEAARYVLTTADVQLGDTVQQLDTGIMYIVTDADHLDSAAGYTEYTAGTAASVPWSGVTGKPTFAAVATSGAYSDLTGTPTIPTVNDATLTIQRNGTTVDTFTANASVDKTININTTDDTKIPLAGSNAISGSLIPATTDAYDLGGSSYQWNNAYIKSLTINGTAAGDILTHNVSEFVDVSSNQIISGLKSFQDVGRYYIDVETKSTNLLNFKILNISLDSETNLPTKGYSFSQNIVSTNPALYLGNYYSVTAQGLVGTDIRNYKYGSNKDYAGISIRYALNDDTYIQVKCNRFVPSADNVTVLGSTVYKWADVNTNLINGINPGALSLPSDTYIDIDTTNYVWGSNFTFTPNYDGYCFLNIGSSSYSRIISLKTSRGEYYFSNQTDVFCFTFPVYKGKLVTILTNSSGTESVIPTIRVFSCQGNV